MARPGTAGRPRTRLGILAILAIGIVLSIPVDAGAAVPRQFFGMSAVLPGENDFQRMGDGGLGSYRIGFNWRAAQRTRKGDFRWGGPDVDVAHAVRNGMVPTPFLYGTPRFISKSTTKVIPPTGSKEDLRLWSRFVTAAAERYGPNGTYWDANPLLPKVPIRKWIVWNEQNARPFWFPKANPRDYARLVTVSDRALTAVDPAARISLGGMYGYPRDKRSMSAVHFLRAFYRYPGIRDHFEIVNVHPYGAGVGTVRKQIKQARGAMRRGGDPDAKILVGELGWATDGPKRSPSVVGTKGQKNRLRKGLELLINRRDEWNIDAAYVYVWRDFPNPTACGWCPEAGLIKENGDPKPAWSTLKQIIARNTAP
jgi:hypothetical protein